MKKIYKILIFLLMVIMITRASDSIFAVNMPVDPGYSEESSNLTNPEIKTKAASVMGSFTFLVQIACVATIIIMGLRYMFASADGKADIKKGITVWTIGAVIVFTATTLIGLVLNVVTGEQYVTVTPNENTQPDQEVDVTVPSNWAEEYWKNANGAGLVPDSIKDKPKEKITRGEFAEVIYTLAKKYGISLSAESDEYVRVSERFSDSKDEKISDYLENIILSLYNAGIMQGTGKDFNGYIVFEPNSPITRQDIATTIYRVLKQKTGKLDSSIDTATCNAVDKDEVASYAKEAVYYFYNAGIIQGVGNNTIDPKGNTTCEQAITIIYRIYSGEE